MRARKLFFISLIILLLLALATVLWVGLQRKNAAQESGEDSYVLIGAPLDGAIVFIDDPVYVRVSALLSQRDPGNFKLYVDGEKYTPDESIQAFSDQAGSTCPVEDPNFCGQVESSQLWIPAQSGGHALQVCLSSHESSTPAWNLCSEEVTVTVTDPSALDDPAGIYNAEEGDSLGSISEKFDLPDALVAAANPEIDASAALAKDTPINIPRDPNLAEPESNTASTAALIDSARMSFGTGIDKAYCYYSFGANIWSRMPAGAQIFAYPLNNQVDLTAQFRSLPFPANGGELSLECWGWSGASLIALGSGSSSLSTASTNLHVTGDLFDLEVLLFRMPENIEPRDKVTIIPPPQNLRRTSKLDECVNHFPPADFLFGPFACKEAVEKSDIILIWEWFVPIFPPEDPSITYVTKIDGFHVYEVDSAGKPSLIKTVPLPDKKTLILPRTWIGLGKFMVRAYAGPFESADSNIYQLTSEPSGTATVTLPLAYGASGGQMKTKSSGFCSVGTAATISIGDSQLAAGFNHFEPGDSCLVYNWEYSRAKFGFDMSLVKGPVSTAELSFRQDFSSAPGQSCARELGVVTTSGSGVELKDLAYDPYRLLSSYGSTGTVFKVDVTEAARAWKTGTPDAGFLFVGRDESLPTSDCGGAFEAGCIGGGSESCWSRYGDVKMTVTYFIK